MGQPIQEAPQNLDKPHPLGASPALGPWFITGVPWCARNRSCGCGGVIRSMNRPSSGNRNRERTAFICDLGVVYSDVLPWDDHHHEKKSEYSPNDGFSWLMGMNPGSVKTQVPRNPLGGIHRFCSSDSDLNMCHVCGWRKGVVPQGIIICGTVALESLKQKSSCNML